MERLKKLAEIAILLPIAHLIACVIFLSGYVTMFGGNVSTLFAASDSFTVTLSNILEIYAITLILPVLTQLYFHYRNEIISRQNVVPVPLVSNVATLEAETESKPPAWIKRILSRLKPWTEVIIFGTLTLFILHGRFINHHPISYVIIFQMFQTSFAFKFHAKLAAINVKKITAEMCWIVLTFVVTAFATGMDRGDSDRHSNYRRLTEDHLRCRDFVVLRSASSRFIAVGKDDKRYVINEKCEVFFEFPQTWTYAFI